MKQVARTKVMFVALGVVAGSIFSVTPGGEAVTRTLTLEAYRDKMKDVRVGQMGRADSMSPPVRRASTSRIRSISSGARTSQCAPIYARALRLSTHVTHRGGEGAHPKGRQIVTNCATHFHSCIDAIVL